MISANMLLSMSSFLIFAGAVFLANFKSFTCRSLGLSIIGFGFVLLPVAIWIEFFL